MVEEWKKIATFRVSKEQLSLSQTAILWYNGHILHVFNNVWIFIGYGSPFPYPATRQSIGLEGSIQPVPVAE